MRAKVGQLEVFEFHGAAGPEGTIMETVLKLIK